MTEERADTMPQKPNTKDPYQKAFNEVIDAINTLRDMIIELAKRTLTIKEYEAFAEALSQKKSGADRNDHEDDDIYYVRSR